jgi:hypothetical protein
MKRPLRALALVAILGGMLSAPGFVLGAEPTAKPACPSLDGDWAGDFDGPFEGQWYATFAQVGTNVQASADITVDSGPRLEAQGSAGVKCEGGRTTIAGSGSAGGKSGSFSGVSDDTGKKLSGTWWSGNLFGTWRGERATEER